MSSQLPLEIKSNKKLIHSVFESIVDQFSSNTAVKNGEIGLTYEELNKGANRLAHALRDIESIHKQPVGVFLPSCSDYIISLIGISKAGGIIMPIDASHPRERLKYVLEKGAPKVIVVNDSWESELLSLLDDCGMSEIRCVNISHDTEKYPDHNPEVISEGDDPSYILFTSGSTGKPKAILGQHKSLSHFIHWEIKEFGLNSECRVSQLAPNTFDVSLRDILSPLLSGGTLSIPSPEQRTNPRLLLEWFEDQKLTLIHCVPSLFRLICREIENSEDPHKRLPDLKHVLLAGEALYGSDVQKWHELTNKRIELINLYGPSETTLAKVFNRIQETPTHPNRMIPIGNPISNTAVLILKNGRLCSIGEIGEIHIKTPFASKGYYRDPELTAAHFIKNPLNPEDPGDVIYKTGDQGRYLQDRSIEFLGRLDTQIKINGIRLEIGELEANIRNCPKIDQTVVVPHQGSGHDYILSCYYTEKSPIAGNEVREYLRHWVPEEIIPAFFIRMDEFPLNINGKVDRKALPKPEDLLYQDTKFRAPTNQLEEAIAIIWGEILGIKQVGIDNSFIELGGDSLKAIRSISRIYQSLGVEISLKDFFPHATVAKLAEVVAKQEKTTYVAIPAIPNAEYYPASHAQSRMWILSQMEENPGAYNIPQSLQLEGSLDVNMLQDSLQSVVNNHETLRTAFIEIHGAPHQRIEAYRDFTIHQIDLSDSVDKLGLARDLALADSASPFDLTTGPLLRVTLIKLSDTHHVLLFCIHHIICDGWSIGILVKEVMSGYNARVGNKKPDAKPLSIHYKDYVSWQNDYLRSDASQKDAEYWQETFAGHLPTLQIPTDHPRPDFVSFEGASVKTTFDSKLSDAIKRISRQESASLFMFLTTLVKVLLHAHSRQEDIIVGTPIAGRSHPDLENQIGLFVNTLALRNHLTHTDRFTEVLGRIKESSQKAYEHQGYPFDRLINDLSLERDTSRSPLFDVLIVLQNNEVESFKLDGLTISDFAINDQKAQFDLTFEFNESDGNIHLNLNYKTNLYKEESIHRFVEQLEALAAGVAENPQLPIGKYSLLSAREEAKLGQLFPSEKNHHETPDLITDVFERKVSEFPDSIALIHEDVRLNYLELNNRANQLARHLQTKGIRPNDVVCLYFERSVEMIIGILGILKAGAVYLPLDPSAPKERLNLIVEDAQAKALLTQGTLGSTLDVSPETIRVIYDESTIGSLSDYSTENLKPVISSDAIAYIIYTSGSTGKPKGTLVTHHNVTRLFRSMESMYDFKETDRWSLFHSIAFDFSVWELWGALFYGGGVVIVPYWVSRSPDAFHDLINRESITVVSQTPSAFYALMNADGEKDQKLASLRKVLIGGEALTFHRLKPWFDRYGDTQPQLINVYGITETTVFVTLRPVSIKDLSVDASLIGIPIPDLKLYVVNQDMKRLPIGMAGELLVGGAGVTLGYLNRPELTEQKFIPDPFADSNNSDPAQKIYRTGDLVRFVANGDIDYLGRIDKQIQLRGFRVELGEIESAFYKHSDIKQAVVVALEGDAGDLRLVAYYTAEKNVSVETLRAELSKTLPEYMIPAAFVQVDEIPLTANGKINTRALPAPVYKSNFDEYTAPSNRSEERLATIWQELLKIERIGTTENFFHLGGHSLLAMQLVSRIREAFTKEISLRQFFQHPNIRDQAALLGEENESKTIIIPEADSSKPIPLSFAQQRLWFIDQYQGNSSTYNMPSALRFKGELNVPALEETLLRIVQRHQTLRTCFPTVDGSAVQTLLDVESFELPVIEIKGSGKSIDELIYEESTTPFDLSCDLPIRAKCIKYSNKEHVLLLTMHHIASDGWSLGVLTAEVNSIYTSLAHGKEPSLPALKIQYSDYAAWQRKRLASDEKNQLLAWWADQLVDIPELLKLPLDKLRPVEQTFNGSAITRKLPSTLADQVRTLSNKTGATPFILLETAFALLMHRYSQDASVVIGSPIANRSCEQLEPLIGFFVNTLALHHRFDRGDTFTDVLANSKNTILGAYDHQDLPFELLVDHLQTERSVTHSPIFQVMFVLQNNKEEQISLPDLEVDFLPISNKNAKFDLTLIVAESDGGFDCTWEYNTDLFERSTIERFTRHYECLLDSIVLDPEQRVSEINLLPTAERKLITNDWCATESVYDETKSAIHLISEQASKAPDSIALLMSDKTMTYGELESRSNQLANHLIHQGIQREDYVGIFMDRSLDMIVALLGTMKAGAAYVPIDAEYPTDRIDYILEDTNAKLLIANEATAAKLVHHSSKIISIDSGWKEISTQSTDFAVNIKGSDLAYLIYTSGSTGRPKGVMIEHSGLSNLIHNVIQKYGLSSKSCTLQFSSLSFDASVWEIFPTLSAGATLQLVDRETILDEESMRRSLIQSRITHLLVTPSYLKYIPDGITSLEAIMTAGEACNPDDLKRWLGKARIFNGYGPTEDTVCSTLFEYKNESDVFSIGRPINNKSVYLLDGNLEVVPIGIPGELYVGGHGLARGYLNQPELTDEKFISNPFGEGRLYRTGDSARWLADGNIEFIGRIDDQVKIRGFRIELGEIEAAIESIRKIQQAAVIVEKNDSGHKRLAAYFTAPETLSAENLRRELKTSLPDYMVPYALIQLDHMPITINGKIDRKALTSMEIRETTVSNVAPENEIEATLLNIWKEVLRNQNIGVRDNFFEIGGDSIIAIQLTSRISKAGYRLLVKELFANPTVAGSALCLASKKDQISITAAGESILHPIQVHFFSHYTPVHHFNQSVLLELPGDIDPVDLEKSIRVVVAHHDAFRARYEQTPDGWKQIYGNTPGNLKQLDIHDLSHLDEAERVKKWETQANELQSDFDLSKGNLIRAAFIRWDAQGGNRLFLCLHHLMVDGVSWRILLEDIQTAYHQVTQGASIELPVKTSSYQQWTDGLKDYANSPEALKQIGHWKSQLPSAGYTLPLDHSIAANQNIVSATKSSSFELSSEQTDALLYEAHGSYHTQINDLLVSALSLSVSDWIKSDTICLELEGHGREDDINELDVSRTVGWFTSLFPLKIILPSSDDLGESIKQVKEQLRGIPNKGLGYGALAHMNDTLEDKLVYDSQHLICFNYWGQLGDDSADSSWGFANETTGENLHADIRRNNLIDVNCIISKGCFKATINYAENAFGEGTIFNLANSFRNHLAALIAHCRNKNSSEHTPSDYPLAKELSFEQLRNIEAAYPHLEDIVSPSPLQKGLFFHQFYDSESGAYTVQVCPELEGKLDLPSFAQAWEMVVAQHTALRASFISLDDGEVFQIISKDHHLDCRIIDWSNLKPDTFNRQLNELMAEDRKSGFALDRGPLLRLYCIRKDVTRTVVLISGHHIILDGWSLPIIFREVMGNYRKIIRNEPTGGIRVDRYQDYLSWIARQGEERARQFWSDQLLGFERPTPLPLLPVTDIKNLPDHSSVSRLSYSLGKSLTEKADVLCKQNQITANTLFQFAWASMLARLTNERDIVFGSTLSGRNVPIANIEDRVGLFINTVPIRIQLDDSKSISETLKSAHANALKIQDHGYYPLFEIQNQSSLTSGEEIFQTLVVFENYPIDDTLLSDNTDELKLIAVQSEEYTHYPLTLLINPGDNYRFELSYREGIYDISTIERISKYFTRMVSEIIENADRNADQINILDENETSQILIDFNDSKTDYPREKSIATVFHEQVLKNPDAIALKQSGLSMTYEELDDRSNQVAYHLIKQGLGNEELVGIYLERSFELIIGILGILKAGGAYVPFDPVYPPERLRYIADHADVKTIITQNKLAESCISICDAKQILIDDIAPNQPRVPLPETNGDSLAYVMYTSGSTGTPKGIAIPQRGMIRQVINVPYLNIRTEDTYLLLSSIAFDASTLQLWAPLLNGLKLALMPPQQFTFEDIENVIRQEKVSAMNITTELFNQLVDYNINSISGLDQLMVGGEALSATHIDKAMTAYPKMRIINMYGPTENSNLTTTYPIPKTQGSSIPIGKPVPNTTVYILNNKHQLQPTGVPGELYTGGDGVARGYYKRPELTEEKFIPNPFGEGKLYATGDLASWLPDGNVEFLGRIDQQVKIRGFRIELQEIEQILSEHPSVTSAAAIVATINKDRHIVAYLVHATETTIPDTEELRDFLSKRLPDYMIPSTFIRMESFPMNPNGKLDRTALPLPLALGNDATENRIAPSTLTEKTIAEIWSKVLSIENIGAQQSFFDLGGHSLKAMQIVTQIHKRLGKKIGIREFFANPTISATAAYIDQLNHSQYDDISIAPAMESYPLSYPQQRLWLLHNMGAHTAYNMPKAFIIEETINSTALNKAYLELINRHEALRTSFMLIEGEPRQKIIAEHAAEIREIDFSQESDPESSAKKFAEEDAITPFDLRVPPHLRMTLIRLGNDRHIILLTMHHIIGDGWSMNVLYDEMIQLYHAYHSQSPSPLKPLRIQYKDFSYWQKNIDFKNAETFWLRQITGMPAHLRLPFDLNPPHDRSFRGSSISMDLDAITTASLEKIALSKKTTLSTVVLSILKLFLFQLTKQNDFSVGVSIANRSHPDLENLIGFFVNVLPVRTQLTGNEDFDQLLDQVIATTEATYEHQDYPLDLLVQKHNPDRESNRQPLFNIVYGFQNFGDITIPLEQTRDAENISKDHFATSTPFDLAFETSKFDLTLFAFKLDDKLRLVFEYDTELFKPATIQNYLSTLKRFAEHIAKSANA